MNRFYVYEHWRPDKDVPFYVGKGCGQRAWSFRPRNRYYDAIVRKLSTLGLCVEVRLIVGELSSEEACSVEIERISFWKASGVRLANMTGGGEGATSFPAELRARIAAGQKGRRQSAETRQKIALAARNISIATRKKRSKSLMGIIRSLETRTKISSSKKSPSATTRERNRVAARQNWARPDVRAKQIAARIGAIRITNGTKNRTIRPIQVIPAGWRRGMIKRREEVS